MSIQQARRSLRQATQAEEEAGASNVTVTTPANQQFHPSAAKCWAFVTEAAGTPAIQTSYNITSITDTGQGILTVTIATDFSSADWVPTLTGNTAGSAADIFMVNTRTAGTIILTAVDTTPAAQDPNSYDFVGFGDQ